MNGKKDQPERHPTKNMNQKPDGQTGIRKEVIGSLKSRKDRQCNVQKKKDKLTMICK
jgi:hypothetical protein